MIWQFNVATFEIQNLICNFYAIFGHDYLMIIATEDSPGAMMYYEWDMGEYSDLIKIPMVEINLTSWEIIGSYMEQAQQDPTMNLTFSFDHSG